MTFFVPIAMFGWIPIVLGLFFFLPPRRAVLIGYIGGWLFLPMAAFSFADVPDYTKYTACSIAVLMGSLLFDRKTLASLRPRLIDVPILVYCLCPMVTYTMNSVGPIAGLSHVLHHLFRWGVPYLIGRAYFRTWSDLRELAKALFIGGLIYLPFIWYELRMSPQLHKIIYGYYQHRFLFTVRYGGYRPRVFMQTGLMLSVWMASVTIIGLVLWRSRSLVRVWGVPMAIPVAALAITTVLCKSGNGILLLTIGMAVLFASKWLRSPIPLLILAMIAPVYIVARATDLWDGQSLVSIFEFEKERAGSLRVRLRQEDVYTDQAWKRPFFGWGGGGFIPRDEFGKKIVRGNDSYWIIVLGLYGLVGLVSIFLALLIAPLMLVFRTPANQWMSPAVAPAMALAIVVLLFAIDCLINAMLNPVYVLAIGGVSEVCRSITPKSRYGRTKNAVSGNAR